MNHTEAKEHNTKRREPHQQTITKPKQPTYKHTKTVCSRSSPSSVLLFFCSSVLLVEGKTQQNWMVSEKGTHLQTENSFFTSKHSKATSKHKNKIQTLKPKPSFPSSFKPTFPFPSLHNKVKSQTQSLSLPVKANL